MKVGVDLRSKSQALVESTSLISTRIVRPEIFTAMGARLIARDTLLCVVCGGRINRGHMHQRCEVRIMELCHALNYDHSKIQDAIKQR